jgi:hypothetical protein
LDDKISNREESDGIERLNEKLRPPGDAAPRDLMDTIAIATRRTEMDPGYVEITPGDW